MKLKMAGLSDIGNVRKNNEDCYYITEEGQLAVVCDGMGGHLAGQEASRLACETIHELSLANKTATLEELITEVDHDLPATAAQLVTSLRLANQRVYQEAQKKPELKGMGTTATAIMFDEGQMFIGHIGDSRAYRIRNGKIQRLTEDHTWVNELIQDKEIAEDQADAFESKNVITRAVGLAPSQKVDVTMDSVQDGDLYLLCSDGLSNALKDDVIHQIIGNSGDIEFSLTCLIAKAKEMNGSDNITAVLTKVIKSDQVNPNLGFRKVVVAEENEKQIQKMAKLIKQLYGGKKMVNEKGQIIITTKTNPIRAVIEIISAAIFIVLITFFAMQAHEAKKVIQANGIEITGDSSYEGMYADGAESPDGNPSKSKGVLAILYYENSSAFARHTHGFTSAILETLEVTPAILQNYQSIELFIRDGAGQMLFAKPRDGSSAGLMNPTQLSKSTQRKNLPRLKPDPKGGVIYFAGYEKSQKYKETLLFINQRQVGKLDGFIVTGIRMQPGNYSISIQDSMGRIIQEKKDITIVPGDIKILEAN